MNISAAVRCPLFWLSGCHAPTAFLLIYRGRSIAPPRVLSDNNAGIYDTPSGDRAVKKLCDGAYRPEEARQYYLDVKEKINSKTKYRFLLRDNPNPRRYIVCHASGEGCFKGIIKDTSETLRLWNSPQMACKFPKMGTALFLRVENFTAEKYKSREQKT